MGFLTRSPYPYACLLLLDNTANVSATHGQNEANNTIHTPIYMYMYVCKSLCNFSPHIPTKIT